MADPVIQAAMGAIVAALGALGFGVKRVGSKVTDVSEQISHVASEAAESRTREADEARLNSNRLAEAIVRLGDRYEQVSTRATDRTELLLAKILDAQHRP